MNNNKNDSFLTFNLIYVCLIYQIYLFYRFKTFQEIEEPKLVRAPKYEFSSILDDLEPARYGGTGKLLALYFLKLFKIITESQSLHATTDVPPPIPPRLNPNAATLLPPKKRETLNLQYSQRGAAPALLPSRRTAQTSVQRKIRSHQQQRRFQASGTGKTFFFNFK
ncbi:hypothetical protein RF11_09418 [Thelohanellus kitauei]|uniref:Uncharacterized protein n=1 Tax=Thelohanellus kitauei TaxID=669202 RepID=A0A0C2J797_THEKT|nr:hypothetical protein RF11_09418 [Thelohanellus kitauei]